MVACQSCKKCGGLEKWIVTSRAHFPFLFITGEISRGILQYTGVSQLVACKQSRSIHRRSGCQRDAPCNVELSGSLFPSVIIHFIVNSVVWRTLTRRLLRTAKRKPQELWK